MTSPISAIVSALESLPDLIGWGSFAASVDHWRLGGGSRPLAKTPARVPIVHWAGLVGTSYSLCLNSIFSADRLFTHWKEKSQEPVADALYLGGAVAGSVGILIHNISPSRWGRRLSLIGSAISVANLVYLWSTGARKNSQVSTADLLLQIGLTLCYSSRRYQPKPSRPPRRGLQTEPTPSELPLVPGQMLRRIDPREIVVGTVTGKGGQSSVCQAVLVGSNEPRAIKLFSLADSFGEWRCELRVARRIARLGSPYLVQMEGCLIIPRTACRREIHGGIVMELLEGQSIENSIRGSVQHRVNRFIEYLRGLRDLHSVGIVHRDIKPGNLWNPKTGPGRIIDFALSRPIHPKTGRLKLETDVAVGTPEFMPPEIYYEIFGGVGMDRRLDHYGVQADIFSMAVSLYSTLARNRTLFANLDRARYKWNDICQMIIRDGVAHVYSLRAPPLLRCFPQCNTQEERLALEALDRIIAKATEFFPQDRYQTADQFLEALTGWKRQFGHLSFPQPF